MLPHSPAPTPTQRQTLAWVAAMLLLWTPQTKLLLRDCGWLEDHHAYVGGTVWLNMPEMGVESLAEVLAIEPCPPLEEGEGRLVTGTFRHTSGEVYDLKLESESKPIGVTATHPFWSVERGEWVSAIDLEIGETLATWDGTTVVESRTKREEPETVFNIEVEGDHVYRVGESGVLVHNVSSSCNLFSGGYFGGDFCSDGGPNYNTGANGRAEKSEARVCSTGGGSDPTEDPVGWQASWNQGLPAGKRRVARCHLLGKQFGGAGTRNNLTPCCHSRNLQMEVVENQVAAFVSQHGCVDIKVKANYSTPGRRIPSSITFTAKGVDSNNNQCRTFTITVNNPSALTQCPVV